MTNSFIQVIKREIGKVSKKPLLLFIMFVLPLLVSFVIGEVFKDGSPKNLPVAVYNQDNSQISRTIIRMIDSTPTCQVKYKVGSFVEGKDLITGGQAYAFVVIPKDFQRDIFRGTVPQMVYYYNNQMLLIGGIITKDVNVAVQTVLAGINVKVQSKKGLPRDVAISRVNIISVDEHVRGNPYLNYSYFLAFAAFAHTMQVLIAFMAIWSVGVEFKEGTTKEWMEVSQNSIMTGVFGKLTPYMMIFMVMTFLLYGIYYYGYGFPFEGNLLFLIFSTFLFVFAYQMMGVMYVALTGNLRLSLSCGAFYTALGFTFSGMTYPSMSMPLFARAYSSLLPLRPYLSLLIDQTLRGIPPKYDIGYIFWMIALSSIGLALLPKLKKMTQDETQWYKS